jgi:hypothetical protein
VIPSRTDFLPKIGVISIEIMTRTAEGCCVFFCICSSLALRGDMMDFYLVSAFLTPTASEISLLLDCMFQ